jgi:hypothetical protein
MTLKGRGAAEPDCRLCGTPLFEKRVSVWLQPCWAFRGRYLRAVIGRGLLPRRSQYPGTDTRSAKTHNVTRKTCKIRSGIAIRNPARRAWRLVPACAASRGALCLQAAAQADAFRCLRDFLSSLQWVAHNPISQCEIRKHDIPLDNCFHHVAVPGRCQTNVTQARADDIRFRASGTTPQIA